MPEGRAANQPRADVDAVFGIGGQHGYSNLVPLKSGWNLVCIYAIGVDPNSHTGIGCYSIAGPPARPPVGYVDSMTVSGSTVTVSGWGFDPTDAETSTQVHVYVDWNLTRTVANQPRPDVNAAFGVMGQHGYSVAVGGLTPGAHLVCVYAIGVDPNTHTGLACGTVQVVSPLAVQQLAVPAQPAAPSAGPAGPAVTNPSASATPTATAVTAPTATGPTATGPTVTVATAPTQTAPTSSPSAASGTATPGTATPDAATGALPAAAATSSTSAPPSTVLSTPAAAPAAKGALESLAPSGSTWTLTGWVADPAAGPFGATVRITLNGVTHDVPATLPRTDVARPDGSPAALGFTDVLALARGSNEVCVYEIDRSGGISTAPLACRTEVVR